MCLFQRKIRLCASSLCTIITVFETNSVLQKLKMPFLRPYTCRNIAVSSIGLLRGLTQQRPYSMNKTLKGLNDKMNKIGVEGSPESVKTLLLVRKAGGLTIIMVLCLVLWGSTYMEPPSREDEKVTDLRQDIRSTLQLAKPDKS